MEGLGNPPRSDAEAVKRRPRSVASRRPRPTEQLASEYRDLSCAPSRGRSRSVSPEDGGVRRKELYLNGPDTRSSAGHGGSKKVRREERAGGEHDGHSRSGKAKDAKRGEESVLALPTRRSSGSPDDGVESGGGGGRDVHPSSGVPSASGDNKLTKVKLKVGGVVRTIHTKTTPEIGDSGAPATSDGSLHWHKQKGSHGLKYYQSTKEGTHGNRSEGKHGNKNEISPSSDHVRKSKRISKKRTLDGDQDDEDGELRYLEKLKVAKVVPEHPIAPDAPTVYDDTLEDGFKKKKLSKFSRNRSTPYEVDEDFIVSRSGRDGRKKLKMGDGTDFMEEEEPRTEFSVEPKKNQKEVDLLSDVWIEPPGLTTRQRALQGRGGSGDSLIEFPDGLPPAPSRKQKEKLSEVEIQAKKAEAAQRRKMQVEKADKEQQDEAIRKILGMDSDKKKEEKKQKEREEKEKQARLEENSRNCIRCVIGPEGTVVTFPNSIGLPSIFNSGPISYPLPREKCGGPSCTNPYKYRDSKTKLPLCSLECYRAVQRRDGQGRDDNARP